MASQPLKMPATPAPEIDYVARVAEIAPLIDAQAEPSERDNKLTPELMTALHDAGLFRMLLPKRFGGAELDPPHYLRTIEALAEHDGSTAWCVSQGNGCTMSAAYMAPETATAIWVDQPEAVVAWGPGKGKAVADGDGFRLTGKWSFASGGRRATWLGGYAGIHEPDGSKRCGPDGEQLFRVFMVPAEQATMFDIWDVIGLRGTGSDGFTTDDLYIPNAHWTFRDEVSQRREDGPLYLLTSVALYAMGFSATALGIARPMLEAFKALAADKNPRLTSHVLRDNAVVQAEVAKCEARLGAARAFLISEVEDIWAEILKAHAVTPAQRMRIRLASTHAIHEAKAVANMAYDLAGATAIFRSSAYERRFRDIHTVAQQLQGRRHHYETVGAFLLGHPPNLIST